MTYRVRGQRWDRIPFSVSPSPCVPMGFFNGDTCTDTDRRFVLFWFPVSVYPQEVLQRGHIHSWFVLFYSDVFPSPCILKRFSTGTYADIYFVLFIAMFPISMYPQEIFNGDTNMQTLCPALIPCLYVSLRDSSTGTHTHAILTRHHVRNQITMTSLQISVTLDLTDDDVLFYLPCPNRVNDLCWSKVTKAWVRCLNVIYFPNV